MKTVTKNMIQLYEIKRLGYDFMGYTFVRPQELSFHHLRISHKDCDRKNIPDQGYCEWNGAILVQNTAHDYLHIIENVDREIFLKITEQMILENNNQKISIENLKKIRDLLLYFEKQYNGIENKKGKSLIREKYITDRIIL